MHLMTSERISTGSTPTTPRPPEEILTDIREAAERLKSLRAELADAIAAMQQGENMPNIVEQTPHLAPYFDANSPVIDTMKQAANTVHRNTTLVALAPETFCVMEGIGRTGIANLERQKRREIVILGTLVEPETTTVAEVSNRTGYAENTIKTTISELRAILALSSVRIFLGNDGTISLEQKQADPYEPSSSDTALQVEEIVTNKLESRGYIPTENNCAYVYPPTLRTLEYLVECRQAEKKPLVKNALQLFGHSGGKGGGRILYAIERLMAKNGPVRNLRPIDWGACY